MRAMQFFKDLSLSAFVAGFVAVLVGFTSSVAIVFQAAQSLWRHASANHLVDLGTGFGHGPVLPGSIAVAAQAGDGGLVHPGCCRARYRRGCGQFLHGRGSGCVHGVFFTGDSGGRHQRFERVADRIPMEIASALLAGVLARFGIQAFAAAQTALPLVLLMVGAYLVARRMAARYAVVVTLVVGILWVLITGQMAWSMEPVRLAMPVFVAPQWSVSAIVSLAIPLFVVTMASQNLPGMAVIRASGYELPVSRLITMTGWASLVLAPFGAFALNFSAITAAICMGPEAHEDRLKRYTAAASCGAIYIVIGLFGALVTGLLTSFPKELVVAIAGIALLSTIGNGLASALRDERHREPALITFLVTLSGITLMDIGSAFWGVVAGSLALFVQQYKQSRSALPR
jgi:benzoate membrane transport protein